MATALGADRKLACLHAPSAHQSVVLGHGGDQPVEFDCRVGRARWPLEMGWGEQSAPCSCRSCTRASVCCLTCCWSVRVRARPATWCGHWRRKGAGRASSSATGRHVPGRLRPRHPLRRSPGGAHPDPGTKGERARRVVGGVGAQGVPGSRADPGRAAPRLDPARGRGPRQRRSTTPRARPAPAGWAGQHDPTAGRGGPARPAERADPRVRAPRRLTTGYLYPTASGSHRHTAHKHTEQKTSVPKTIRVAAEDPDIYVRNIDRGSCPGHPGALGWSRTRHAGRSRGGRP